MKVVATTVMPATCCTTFWDTFIILNGQHSSDDDGQVRDENNRNLSLKEKYQY